MAVPALISPTAPPNAPPLLLHVVYRAIGFCIFFLLLWPTVIFCTISHYLPGRRPYPTWSLRRHLAVATGRTSLAWTHLFALPRLPGKGAWKEKVVVRNLVGRGTGVAAVRVPPAGDELRVDVAAVAQDVVKAEEVPGFWTFQPSETWIKGDEKAYEGEKVIMYIPGGSWVMGHPQGTPFPYAFCKVTHHRVLSINHRKAVTAATAFPAQLLDLLAGFAYLRSLGFAPQNIALVGDSSGGHLILALSRYLSVLGESKETDIGMPGAMLLISPSSDLSHPPAPPSSTDFLVPYINERVYPSLTRHYAPDVLRTSPYFSPAVCGSFAYLAQAQLRQPHGFAIWIQYGEVENLVPDTRRLLERLSRYAVQVETDMVRGGVHLDAGIAFVLGERGPESSWVRLLEAVERLA